MEIPHKEDEASLVLVMVNTCNIPEITMAVRKIDSNNATIVRSMGT